MIGDVKTCSLASSSNGNCIYVELGGVKVLVDAGLSGIQTRKRLSEIDVGLDEIDGVLITHEHEDHIKGARVLKRKTYVAQRVYEKLYWEFPKADELLMYFDPMRWFRIGGLSVFPFRINHDAVDPVGFVLTDGVTRIGILGDVGSYGYPLIKKLEDCDILYLEFNYDENLVNYDELHPITKGRVVGPYGHMSNQKASVLLSRVATERLKVLFITHISRDRNNPAVALKIAQERLSEMGLKGLILCYVREEELVKLLRGNLDKNKHKE